ncbi:asparagine synthase-related protein [Lysobacter niabensis]|uniref:asparagine synthase-related protein n=1 Tax=Agrilutibacter niabensis TaxID=380628 RepID=UPI0036182D02
MARRGNEQVYASADGAAVFAQLLREAPAHASEAPVVVDMPVVVDGELYHRGDLLALLDPELRAAASADDAALVRCLYRTLGPPAFAKLRGRYALALYDPASRTLHLASDVVGLRTLAWRADAERACFASEQKAVLALSGVAPAPNDAALAQLLLGYRTGAFARGEGLFDGVGILGRGEHVALRDGTAHRSRVQDFDLRPHGPRPYPELCEEFRVLFRQAVARSLDPARPTAITVSGGLDSSSIYCVAKNLEAEGVATGGIVGINFTAEDGSWADERSYTGAIVERYGPGIVRVPMQPDGFLASLDEAMRASESPLVNPAGNLFQRQYATAAGLGASTFVMGYWGDEAFAPFNHWFHLLWSLRVPTLLRVAREHHRWIVETPVTARDTLGWVVRSSVVEFTPAWMRRAYRWLRPARALHPLATGRLGAYREAAATTPLVWRSATRYAHWQRDLLDAPQHRQFLGDADREMAAHGMRAAHPFLDPDLVQFLLRCDGSQINPGGRYKGLLRDALRQDVPAAILDRTSKGDFTEAYGAGRVRDLATMLGAGPTLPRLAKLNYLPEQMLDSAKKSVNCLTLKRDDVHIAGQLTDCAGLGHWLGFLYADRGHENDVQADAGHRAQQRQAGL